MSGAGLQILLCAVFGIGGAVAGYIVAAVIGTRRIREVTELSQKNLDELGAEKEEFAALYSKAHAKFESLRAEAESAIAKRKEAVRKAKILAQNVQTLRTERETTKAKVSTLQSSLTAVHERTKALQREFEKAGVFYKRELTKSFNKRKQLEEDLVIARSAQEEFQKRVEASVLEHGSEEEMVVAAQLRLGQIDVLERNIGKLETENAELREEAKQTKKDYDAIQKDLSELDELKIHNQQLVQAVEALERSRKQHEDEAEQFRDKADESEQLSETLRMRLNDLEQSFAAMEEQQDQAIQHVRDAAASAGPAANQDTGDSQITNLTGSTGRR
ncbi:MAG: hypothetical protein QNJ00_18395 [Woeseiaceae bacterium]|nr:hypothetical protein [Woeseiaceae bacterium]